MDLKAYLEQPVPDAGGNKQEAAQKQTSYEDFSNKMWTVEAPVISNESPDLTGMLSKINDISGHLTNIMRGDEQKRDASLAQIKEMFPVQNKKQTVTLSREFVKAQAEKAGVAVEDFNVRSIKFGVKTLDENAQFANAQLDRLQADVKKIRQYQGFEDVEVHVLEDKGQRIALVVGADANDVNSLLAAVKTKEQLEKTLSAALTPELSPQKKQGISIDILTGKVAELADKYPASGQQKTEPALAENDLQKPSASLPGQQKSNVREVA
jgi:ASC-1-like (ASCH) protein